MIHGKDGQGIFDATFTCTLSSICAIMPALSKVCSFLLKVPSNFMLFSK